MKKFLLIVLLLGLAAGGVYWWQLRGKTEQVRILAAEAVSRGSVRQVLEQTGIIKAQVGAMVKIGARSTGTLEKMLVRVGEAVTRGQLVARIDSRELRAQQAEARAQLVTAQAQATLSRGNYQRRQALFADQFVSREELEQTRQQAEVDAARVKAAEAALRSIDIRISYTEVFSPIAGVVSQVTAQEGETIVAGLQVANLVTVLDPQRLEMWVYVDETDVGQVQPDQLVEFRVDAYPGRVFSGSVRTIYPQPEIRDNIVYYQALVDVSPEQASALRPEMTTQVQIVVAEKTEVLILPNSALKWVDGRQVVFVREPGGSIRELTPKLGLAGLSHSEIVEGLQEGAEVATQVVLPKAAAKKGKP
ncbi:MAG: efflux RND transporter periplasmic adaptor subunit [Trichloromonadaceae bacterium]